MGLFGFNPEKKLAKADEQLGKGFYYDARLAYEEILKREGIPDAIRAQAKAGWRKARLALIAGQLEEAKRLLAAGAVDEAAESSRTAVELAEDDLDSTEARGILRQIEDQGSGPKRAELIKQLVETAEADATPPRQIDDAAPEQIVNGGSEEEVFEVYMNAFPDEIAAQYRDLGQEFREAYVRLQEGNVAQAIAALESAPEEVRKHPLFLLELGQALLIADRNQEALQAIEDIAVPAEVEARRRQMRVILLDRLGRWEEAEVEAERLWKADPRSQELAVLYGEMLIARGKHQAVLDVLKPLTRQGRPQPEIDNLVAQAYRGVGRTDDARNLLEMVVERYFQGGYASGDMQRFPIWAGRQLLEIYVEAGEDPDRIEALRNHLIKQDPGNANLYIPESPDSAGAESAGERDG